MGESARSVRKETSFMFKKPIILGLLAAMALIMQALGCASAQRRADGSAASAMMDEAKTLYDQQRFGSAARLFKKLSDRSIYDDTYAEEATFYLGECSCLRADYVDAYHVYERLLGEYPRTRYYEKAVEREFVIGADFCTGRKAAFWKRGGWGAKVLLAALAHRPFGEYSAEARMILADYYLEAGDYDEALHHYDLLTNEYAGSKEAKQAPYRRALCLYHNVQGNRYNSDETGKAIEGLETAEKSVAAQPKSNTNQDRLGDIQSKLKELHEIEAREYYDLGRFFLKNGNRNGAAAYFSAVVKEAPGSSYAALAQKALDGIVQEQN